MKITMAQLEAFHAVMTLGTATAAASVSNTSQPSITRAILQLEQATSLNLFERKKGRLVPTPDASELFLAVQDSFHGIGHIRRVAENIQRRRVGRLRFACLPAFSQGFIARVVAEFSARYPQVDVSVNPLLSSDIISAVRDRAIDLGVAAYEADAPGLRSQRFTNCDEVVIMPKSHRLATHGIIRLTDIAEERIVRLQEGDPYSQRLVYLLDQYGLKISSSVETQTSASICAMVAEGVGIALVNPLTAIDFLNANLVLRPFEQSFPFVTTLVQPARATRSKMIDAFVNLLMSRRDLDLDTARRACEVR